MIDDRTESAVPRANLHLGDEEWHDGPGWYYTDDEYPDEGSCGSFETREAAAAPRRERGGTMKYRVWIPDHGETAADARELDAMNISMAACIAADYDHDLRGGWDWAWPVTYRVQAEAGCPVYSVVVNRKTVPEFYAEKPRLV